MGSPEIVSIGVQHFADVILHNVETIQISQSVSALHYGETPYQTEPRSGICYRGYIEEEKT